MSPPRYAPDGSFSGIGPDPTGRWIHLDDCDAVLRPVRLYHWNRCVELRDAAYARGVGSDRHDALMSMSSYHLSVVQQLNEFFEPGDTAEADTNKNPRTA